MVQLFKTNNNEILRSTLSVVCKQTLPFLIILKSFCAAKKMWEAFAALYIFPAKNVSTFDFICHISLKMLSVTESRLSEFYFSFFQIWMCGGKVFIVTCSRVGHVFRKTSPYSWPGGVARIINHNTQRIVEVWMDEYKDFFYKINPGEILIIFTKIILIERGNSLLKS